MRRKNSGDLILKDYIWQTYRIAGGKIFSELKRHLRKRELSDIQWHVTLVGKDKAVIFTEKPRKLKNILVTGTGFRPVLFKPQTS